MVNGEWFLRLYTGKHSSGLITLQLCEKAHAKLHKGQRRKDHLKPIKAV